MAMSPTLIGQTLAGKYRVIERLGQGQNAVVYKAQQLNLDRFVALKVIERGNRAGYERLQQESRVLAQFHHPGIRQVYGIEADGPYIFAVLDYLEHSLRHRIEARRQQRQGFDRAEVVQLLRPIGQVLDYLHGCGWAHMDVKPENILVADDSRVMLADFGVAQPFGAPKTLGTATYVAPEVINAQPIGAATDLYSLAVIAFEMLAGAPPFTGDAAVVLYRQHTETLPPSLDRLNRQHSNSVAYVVNRALAKDPQQRYGSALAFLNTLVRADTVSVRLPTLPRRRPVPTAIAAASLVCASVLGIGGFILPPAIPTPTPTPTVISVTPTPTQRVLAGEIISPTPTNVIVKTTTPTTTPRITVTPMLTPILTTPPEKTAVITSTSSPTPSGPACKNLDAVPGVSIVQPAAGAQLPIGPITIRGTADLPDRTEYELQYRSDTKDPPGIFHYIDDSTRTDKVINNALGVWDPSKLDLKPGDYTLKLRVKLTTGNYKDCDVPIVLK
jgi:serine/threonine-protein kinase